MIAIFGLIVVVLFVIGIVFLFKGYADAPDVTRLVPKEDFEKMEKDLGGVKEHEEKLKVQLDSLTLELEGTRAKLREAEKNGGAVDALKSQEEEYRNKIQELEKDLALLKETAAAPPQETVSAGENQKLTEGLQQLLEKIDEVEKEVLSAKPAGSGESGEDIQKIKEVNAHLLEKDKRLQLELTKSRTQIAGLEAVCRELKAQSGQIKADQEDKDARDAKIKAIEADCLRLEQILEEQRQYSSDIKQRMEENKMKVRLLSEKAKEGVELIAQFVQGQEFEEFRKSIHLDEITQKYEDEIKALRIKNMEFEKEAKSAGN